MPGSLNVVGQNSLQFRGRFALVILGKQKTRLLLIAHKAGAGAQKVPPFHGNAHVGDHGKHRLMIFFRKGKDPLHDFFIHVDLQRDAVGVPEDFIPLFL